MGGVSRCPRAAAATTDRVRESLFNVLTARMDLHGAAVLDLYAGSGALGLEALSRGAANAVFVESDQRAPRSSPRTSRRSGHRSDGAPRHCRSGGGGRREPRRPGLRRPAVHVGESEVNEMLAR